MTSLDDYRKSSKLSNGVTANQTTGLAQVGVLENDINAKHLQCLKEIQFGLI